MDVHAQSGLDPFDHTALDRGAFVMGLLKIIPSLQTNRVRPRQPRETFAALHALDQHIDFVARLYRQLSVLHKLGLINDAFRLVAEINHHAPLRDSDHPAANDLAFMKSSLLLLELVEQTPKVFT